MADKPQEEFGGKGGSGDVSGSENLFVCPECTAEHAFGIHSGLALITPGKTGAASASGMTISLANRLMQQAESEILITHEHIKTCAACLMSRRVPRSSCAPAMS